MNMPIFFCFVLCPSFILNPDRNKGINLHLEELYLATKNSSFLPIRHFISDHKYFIKSHSATE